MPPIPSTTSGPSAGAADESAIIRQLRKQIADTEKNLSVIHAGAAVAKAKYELAIRFERYAREELVAATNSLSCKYPRILSSNSFVVADSMTRSFLLQLSVSMKLLNRAGLMRESKR